MSEQMLGIEVNFNGSVENAKAESEAERLAERRELQREFLLRTLEFSPEMQVYLERFPEARDFLVERLFDRGLGRALEPMQLKEGLEIPEAAAFFGEREVPLVLNSFCRPLLERAGYSRYMGFDLSGVFAANQLPTTREKAGGDFLIRNAAAAVYSQVDSKGYVLVRVGGDEFEIWRKGEEIRIEGTDQDRELYRGKQQEELNGWLGQEVGLYSINGEVVAQPIKAEVKDLLPGQPLEGEQGGAGVTNREAAERLAMARLQYPQLIDEILLQHFEGYEAAETVQLLDAFEDFKRLTAHHKEFREVWSDLLAALTVPEVAPMVELFATVLEDPLLKSEVEKLNGPGRDISVHHDMLDWLHHVTWKANSEQAARLTVLKVEVPGLLKQFNDEAKGGYAKGDQFLIEHFGRLVQTLEQTLSALKLPVEVQIWRRGGDFYVGLLDLEIVAKAMQGYRAGKARVTEAEAKQWLVQQVEAGVIPSEPVQYMAKDGQEAEAVVLPVAAVVERQFMPQASGSKFFPADSTRLVWREMLDEFDREAVPRRVYGRLIEALRDPNTSERTARMMRTIYFKPQSPRGDGRLARLELTKEEEPVMEAFLKDGSRQTELCEILDSRATGAKEAAV